MRLWTWVTPGGGGRWAGMKVAPRLAAGENEGRTQAARSIRFYPPGVVADGPMEPVLQVALDFMHAKRAVQAAKEAVEGGADWIEAGTPLIKSEGVEIVRQLRKL